MCAVSLRPRKRVRGTLPSAVGSQELFEVVKEMFSGKGIYIIYYTLVSSVCVCVCVKWI